jgi:isoleucyl-tRNA synthetase
MYYATDSWFIQTTSFKERMIELNNTINWTPEEFGTGRFGNWLEENKDWALSRNRFWGTPLPIWSCDDINGNKRYVCIGSIEELKEKSSNFDEVYKEQIDLHRPYIDEIKMKSEDGTEMNREPVVIDCWFDSGSMPFAQYHYPFENKEFFKKHYPGDFIAEGIDQTRGWFYSLHAIGTFLFDKPAYKNLIVNGLILDKNAKKMSKTAGNVVNPFEIMEKFGADILRWYLVASSPVWKSKLFNENDLVDIKNKFFDTLINTFKFFIIYANISNFVNEETEKIIENKRVEIDKWLISKLNTVKKEYFYLMDKYEITKAARIVYDFTIDELSNWYVRRNRKRFRNPSNNFDKLSAYQTLYEVLIEILKLIAPLAPFISEKLYLELTNDNGSIHLSEFSNYCESNIDIQLEEQMNLAQRIVYLVRAVRVKNNLKVRQPLRQLLIPVFSESKKKQLLKVKDIILDEINVKELKVIDSDSGIIKKKTKPNFKSIGPKFGKEVKKVQNIIINFSDNEIKTLEVNKEIIKDNFKIDINDVEILTENIDGWIIESDGEITIALDTKLDKDLINEGFIREFINRVQNYRKSNDFNVDDKINIKIRTDKELSEVLIKNFKKYSLEVSCEKIEIADNSFSGFTKTDINGIELEFQIEKI